MNKFFSRYVFRPFAGHWIRGGLLLVFWTVAFIALPAVSGWFLAMCSVAFLTANLLFAYIVPATVIRFLALSRTAARYFERVENHKTTLEVQRSLQLMIFRSVARFPYFKKQREKNSSLLEIGTRGVDRVLNHVLLWILPLAALLIAVGIYFLFLALFSRVIAAEFLFSSALLLFILPRLFNQKNAVLYRKISECREEHNRELIQSLRGRIEISKYRLGVKVQEQFGERTRRIERLDKKLRDHALALQLVAGLGFSLVAALLFRVSAQQAMDAPMAIGIFFGMLAQAELAEILFSGKSEKCSVAREVEAINGIIREGDRPRETVKVNSRLERLDLHRVSARIPETSVTTPEISLEIKKGEWVALFGQTGKGKSTFLNALFYPEYRMGGSIHWNSDQNLPRLPIPQCIYVAQQASLLTGTLRENFGEYPDQALLAALKTVDLGRWFASLPSGLSSWIGENGEMLSGGQRKKLLLAQALLKNPQLLVVDEPTAGIGSGNAIALFQAIRRKHPEMAILMATHLRDFERVVDRVVTI